MKKIILTATLAICTVGLFAQAPAASGGLMSKRGEMFLPEAGDWAVTFNATPFLNYLGNAFNAGGASGNTNTVSANFLTNNNTIVGKYFVDANTAYRGILRIGFGSNSWTNLTTQDVPVTNPITNPPNPSISAPTVNDKLSVSNHFIGLGAGMEKRKGKTRLQGYYGAELMFWLASAPGGDSTMTYGNSYNVNTDPSPSYYNWRTKSVQLYSVAGGGRTLSDNPGSIFGISVLAFVGVEYFIVPKISLGAEYTWGLNFVSQGQGSESTEIIYNPGATPTPPAVDGSFTTKTGGASHFGLDTGVNSPFGNSNAGSADITLTFHF